MKKAHKTLLSFVIFVTLVVSGGSAIAIFHPIEFFLNERTIGHSSAEFTFGMVLSSLLVLTAYGCWSIPRLHNEVDQRKKAQSAALELAKHDPLTGLPNRRKFHDNFQCLSRSTSPGKFRAVMMLDIDGFKPINDVYGHAFGDALLVAFAERLDALIDGDGFVARLGGDEFAIVSAEFSSKAEVAGLARRLLLKVQQTFEIDAKSVSIGTGIGIALFPEDGFSTAELLRRADIALYRAKVSGRSSFRFFEVAMDASILHRTLLEQRLRTAIAKNEVEVHYQPILNLKTRAITGFEALARWKDKDFGQVPPDEFIPLAEDSGLITDLTFSLLAKAASTAARWPDEMTLSFNLSAILLADTTLPLKVLRTLNDARFPPDRLTLEITETAIIKNPALARHTLEQLSGARIRIALDDFGTGHSSLNYLRDFPIHTVKIDKSFTMRMSDSAECRAIVDAVLVLSKGMGFDTIAEGIEQKDILDDLNASGCHLGQGFLFGAATSAEAVDRLIEENRTPGAVEYAGDMEVVAN